MNSEIRFTGFDPTQGVKEFLEKKMRSSLDSLPAITDVFLTVHWRRGVYKVKAKLYSQSCYFLAEERSYRLSESLNSVIRRLKRQLSTDKSKQISSTKNREVL